MKILFVFGTRPEAIKLAPVIQALRQRSSRGGIQPVTCVTAQHRQMLDQVLEVFGIRPDIDLDLMEANQTLPRMTARSLISLADVMRRERPDLILVQGDTSTAMVASLAAFYEKIPVGHIEAGLRTRNRYSPFPEEVNRRVIAVLATYHFAPTQTAVANLRREGIAEGDIYFTGNTVIDALLWVAGQPPTQASRTLLEKLQITYPELGCDKALRSGPSASSSARQEGALRTILVTAHRRENFGRPFERVCKALRAIVQRNAKVQIVYPVHLNPNVREPAIDILGGLERLHLIDPLPYEPFVQVMKNSYLVITDSGGIQEEAPALGKPVLVIREETERPEAVEAGCAKIVGTDTDRVVAETERLIRDETHYARMARAVCPYGDGQASKRIVDAISKHDNSERLIASSCPDLIPVAT